MWQISFIIGIFFLLYISWTGYSIWSFSLTDNKTQTDAAIVLGAASKGEEPSPVFEKRIDHAIRLYKENYVENLIFTGGKGEKTAIAESEAAEQYALDKDIPAQDILIETKSQITEQNLQYANSILQHHDLNTATLVSDPLHMKRAVTIAEDLNMNVVSSPASDSAYKSLRTKIPFFLREWFFYTGYQILSLFRF